MQRSSIENSMVVVEEYIYETKCFFFVFNWILHTLGEKRKSRGLEPKNASLSVRNELDLKKDFFSSQESKRIKKEKLFSKNEKK